MTKTRKLLPAVVSGGLVLAACGGTAAESGSPSAASPRATDIQSICAAAQQEGVVNFASAQPPNVWREIVQGFEQHYPDIKVNHTTVQGSKIPQQIIPEVQAGRPPRYDAIDAGTSAGGPEIMAEHGLIQDVDWGKLGTKEEKVITLKSSGLSGVQTRITLSGLGYNTNLVKPSELPDTWEGLVNSKWAGKIIVDPRGVKLASMVIPWGKDKLYSWYERLLMATDPQVVEGTTSSLIKVGTGEALLSTSARSTEILEQQAQGAPVEIKYLDISMKSYKVGWLLKNAQHPNAGLCFLAWYAGPDGSDVRYKAEKALSELPEDMPSNTKVVSQPTTGEALDRIEDAINTLSKLTTGIG